MTLEDIKKSRTLDELLSLDGIDEFPDTYGQKTHIERYKELRKKFENYPVEMGAMQAAFQDWKSTIFEVACIEDKKMREDKLLELYENDPIVFLNRHDASHTKKVMERALELMKCFSQIEFSKYEIYFLMCAIIVHDVGNLYGRMGHEKNISNILDTECTSIIPDSIERRTISRIAGVHGGKIHGNADTIAFLKREADVNKFKIKEQVLASILRFADELADDASRANYEALNSGILDNNTSKIYHIYSEKLHTVSLQKNKFTEDYEVFLAYQFDSITAQILFDKGGQKTYLLDEIYARTIKMERERRYCIRYLRPYCSLERINVEIVIVKSTFDEMRIAYPLEEKGYPARPVSSIKDIREDIPNGEELITRLEGTTCHK